MLSLHVDVFKRGPMRSSCHNQYLLDVFSFSLRSRRLEVVGARKKGRSRGRHARGTQANFSSLMCMTFHQIPVHSHSIFPINDKEEEETRHNTEFLLHTIHEHSKMHMMHELCAFVDRVKCLKVTTDINSLLDLECSSV